MGVASDTYAELTRAQYDDWYERFYPQQQALLEKTQSGELLTEQLDRADENAATSLAAAEEASSAKMGRYGLSGTVDSSQKAKLALSNAATKNNLRDYEQERSLSVLSGSGYSLKSAAMDN
jgi:flagellar hook-basal body complex protein FliE